MRSILNRKHNEQLEEEKKLFCFAYGNTHGDVIITCNDGTVQTQSVMLMFCSKRYQNHQMSYNNEDIKTFSLPYDINIVTMVLKTYYGEYIDFPKYMSDWKNIKKYFELLEYLIPCKYVSIYVDTICNMYISHIINPNDNFLELSTLTKKGIYRIIHSLSKSNNKYLLKLAYNLEEYIKKRKLTTNEDLSKLRNVLYHINN